MSSASSVITRSITSPLPTSRRNKTQQPPPPTPRSKWTEIEHGQLVDGIATYGIDNKKELELLIPSRSAGAVSTYLTRNRDKLLSDYRKFYNKGSDDYGGDTDDDDDDHDVDVDVDSEEEEDDDSKDDNDKDIKRSAGNQSSVSSEISPPKKKVKRNEDDDEEGDNNNNFSTATTTEPVGFFASVSRFLSGTWFWPSQMPPNDDGNNGDNDGTTNIETTAATDKNNDDDDDKADENEMKVSKSDDDGDDLLQFLPDVGIKFLNSMNINSGRELLESKSGELGDQYTLFREENDMSVYKGNGASGIVSQWKKIIRDEALVAGDNELANFNTNKSMTYIPQKKSRGNQQKQYTPVMTKHSAKKTPSRPITTNGDNDGDDDDDDLLQLLPNGGVQFLSSINIKSARAFLETKTGNVSIEYKSFREAQTGKQIKSVTAVSRIGIWKATIRDAALAGGDIELANLNLKKQHQFKNSKN